MICKVIPKALSKAFYGYGHLISRYPLPFIISPIVICLFLSIGLIRFGIQNDAEYLFSPINAKSSYERQYFEDSFLYNDVDRFTPVHSLRFDGYLSVLIESKDELNVLHSNQIAAIKDVHNLIINVDIEHEGNTLTYKDICSSWKGQCYTTGFIRIVNSTESSINITFPVHLLNNIEPIQLRSEIGGVETYPGGVIKSARSVRLWYNVASLDSENELPAAKWVRAVQDKILSYKHDEISVSVFHYLSMPDELYNTLISAMPRFVSTYFIMVIFAVLACMRLNLVRAKPWVAVSALVAALMGVTSSVSILSAAQVPFSATAALMPFLMIGIGIDDLFLLVSAWQMTDYNLAVNERIAQMLEHSAVSITITSLTDGFAFAIGCLSPFRAVRIFCAYAAVAVLFVYTNTLTFTVGAMVYSGRREAQNQGCCCCIGTNQTDNAPAYTSQSINGQGSPKRLPRYHLSGEKVFIDQHEEKKTDKSAYENALSSFFGTTYTSTLLLKPVKVIVLIAYLTMLIASIYGLVTLEEGLDKIKLVEDDSYVKPLLKAIRKYYGNSSGPVIVVGINEDLDYSEATNRQKVEDLLESMQSLVYFSEERGNVISWLHNYENYLVEKGLEIDTLNSTHFVSILHDFLTDTRYEKHTLDVTFDQSNTRIIDTRMFLQAITGSENSIIETNIMIEVRNAAKNSPLNVITFSKPNVFNDQYLILSESTLFSLGMAVLCMVLIAILLIPSVPTIICVTLATASICFCIVGFMSFWDLNLDSITSGFLIITIGFSVDFTAHISYHFSIDSGKSSNEKLSHSLSLVGLPISMAALSTILAVSTLSTASSYVFRALFKIILLNMLFGLFHGLVLLPVILSSFSGCKVFSHKKNVIKRHKRENQIGGDFNRYSFDVNRGHMVESKRKNSISSLDYNEANISQSSIGDKVPTRRGFIDPFVPYNISRPSYKSALARILTWFRRISTPWIGITNIILKMIGIEDIIVPVS